MNGEEFYRVNEDSDDCLLDIVSYDEIVYILDENSKLTNKISSNYKCELTSNELDLVNEEHVHLTTSLNSSEVNYEIANESNKKENEHSTTNQELGSQLEAVMRFPSSHSLNFLTSKKICDF